MHIVVLALAGGQLVLLAALLPWECTVTASLPPLGSCTSLLGFREPVPGPLFGVPGYLTAAAASAAWWGAGLALRAFAARAQARVGRRRSRP